MNCIISCPVIFTKKAYKNIKKLLIQWYTEFIQFSKKKHQKYYCYNYGIKEQMLKIKADQNF